MLVAMDIAGASAQSGTWIAVGVLVTLAVLLVGGVVTALVARRRSAPPPPPVDDLPVFLESPPGTRPPVASGGDHVPLVAPAPPPAGRRPVPPAVLAGVGGLAVLLLVAAAVVGSGVSTDEEFRPAAGSPSPPSAEVRMTFAGLVLEERAVGVTAAYPELELTGEFARLTLPTWNCLAADAPDDPSAAGCVPTRTEYAELRPPDLVVTETGDELRLTGEFATETRPAGGDPEPTGRSYRIEVTVTDAGGVLVLGDQEAESVD
jgi:hypothetical protein